MTAASDKLEKAYQLPKVPSLGLWSARALEKRGLLLEALTRYLEASSMQVPGGEAAVQHKAQADAQREGAALKARLPRVVISLEGAEPNEVTLTIEGRSISAAGVTLLLTTPSKSGPSAALQVAPTALELRGRF